MEIQEEDITLQEAAVEGVEGTAKRTRGKPLSNGQRDAILHALLSRSSSSSCSKLDHGALSSVAKLFGVTRLTVSNIWKRAKKSLEDGADAMVVSHHKKNSGRKKKDYSDAIANIASIPLSNRTCLRSTSAALGIPMTALHAIVKAPDSGIRSHTSTIKPVHTEKNMKARVQYSISNIDLERGRFKTYMDVVHVDEKWFNMKEVTKRYYLGDGEPDPQRKSKSKRYIEKIMFLCAVARPRHDTHSNTDFDGKLGIWPFVHMVRAQQTSPN